MFVGAVMASALSNIPDGWLLCDGSSLNISQYSDLFSAIGYVFGGSGSSFNLPDLRERFIRGAGAVHSLGTSESDSNQSHSHAVSLSGGSHGHRLRASGASSSNYWTVTAGTSLYNAYSDGSSGTPMVELSSHSHSGDTASQGSSECKPKNLTLVYLIRYLPFEFASSGNNTIDCQTEEDRIKFGKSIASSLNQFYSLAVKVDSEGNPDFSKMWGFVPDSSKPDVALS